MRIKTSQVPTLKSMSRFAALLIVTACCLVDTASAQSVRRPLGLAPGDDFRLLFFTDGLRDATSANIEDYNAFVSSEASSSNSLVRDLDTEWFAIASTAAVSAIENTQTDPSPAGETGVPIFLVDGVSLVADSYDNWWDGDSFGLSFFLSNAPNLTQSGAMNFNDSNNVWNGTNAFGESADGFTLGGEFAVAGDSRTTNGRQVANVVRSTTLNKSFYAISGVLTAVPEPSSAILLAFSSMSLCISRRRALATCLKA